MNINLLSKLDRPETIDAVGFEFTQAHSTQQDAKCFTKRHIYLFKAEKYERLDKNNSLFIYFTIF